MSPSAPMRPLVIIPCDHRDVKGHLFHMVGEKYIEAVVRAVDALPWLVPVLDPPLDVDELLARADGVLLTGSSSNVGPKHYAGLAPREGVLQDPRRDDTTLTLIRRCLDLGVPLLAICRGFQELNVALGGSLHQHLQEIDGRFDHRADSSQPVDIQYDRAHSVSVIPGGLLASWTGLGAIEVNSLHSQGIDRLAPGLMPEAVARDGTVEAVHVKDATSFAFGVQWHPEWKFEQNPVSLAIFDVFGQAVRERHTNNQLKAQPKDRAL